MTELEKIHEKLDKDILRFLLPLDSPILSNDSKVIHDHLWGSSTFYAWEVSLLDTPLLQRLRQIHQLGTASFTYPSAVHNRFSHTLGVTVLAGQLITNLREKLRDGTVRIEEAEETQDQHEKSRGKTVRVKEPEKVISQRDVYSIRLAALLHDIGHAFFSHCTEKLAEKDLSGLQQEISLKFSNSFSSGEAPKFHELIAYAIVTSPHFIRYWDTHLRPCFDKSDDAPTPEEFARPIIGAFISNEKRYLTEILNGPYDVDKLEYLHRDAKSAGLAITYDRERFFQKITLYYDKDHQFWQLVMGVHGIQSVEQMMLNKMMLAPYVYHHQKVLITDAIVQDIGKLLLAPECEHNTIKAENYLDFLLYSDADLLAFSSKSKNEPLDNLLRSLRNRVTPKRCFVLHKDFICCKTEKDSSNKFSEIRKEIFQNVEEIRESIAEKLTTRLKKSVSSLEVYVTNTSQKAKYKNIAKSALVLTQDNTLAPLGDHWVMGNWDETYSAKKELIYFHVATEYIQEAHETVFDFLVERFEVGFHLQRVKSASKIKATT